MNELMAANLLIVEMMDAVLNQALRDEWSVADADSDGAIARPASVLLRSRDRRQRYFLVRPNARPDPLSSNHGAMR